MKSINSAQLLQEIDETIENIKSFSGLPQLATTYFAQFLVVYICGIYEEIIESTVVEMADKSQEIEITNFIKNLMKSSFRNPNWEKIKYIFTRFENEDWIKEICDVPDSSKSALNSIVVNKNALAHGSSSLNLTISDVEDYYKKSKIILEKIDELLL